MRCKRRFLRFLGVALPAAAGGFCDRTRKWRERRIWRFQWRAYMPQWTANLENWPEHTKGQRGRQHFSQEVAPLTALLQVCSCNPTLIANQMCKNLHSRIRRPKQKGRIWRPRNSQPPFTKPPFVQSREIAEPKSQEFPPNRCLGQLKS